MSWAAGTFTRGNGTFTGATVWAQDKAAGTKITSANHDTHDQDLADGINACLTKDGSNSATANLNLGGFRYTNAGAATSRTDLARASQVQDGAIVWGGSTAGAAGAYTANLSPAVSSLATGCVVRVQLNHSISGSTATLNLNGSGALSIFNFDGSALATGQLRSGQFIEVIYDGSAYRLRPGHRTGLLTWTPSYTTPGLMTWTPATNLGVYEIFDGKVVEFTLDASGAAAGTAQNTVTFTLPSSLGMVGTYYGSGEVQVFNSSFVDAWVDTTSSTTQWTVRKVDGTNYTAGGTNLQIHVWGRYYLKTT